MSGQNTHIDASHQGRRDFLLNVLKIAGFAGFLSVVGESCKPGNKVKARIVGANHKTGHLLRDINLLPAPEEVLYTNVLIIGGGISGLAAKHSLYKAGIEDVMMVELADETGGNSAYGQNNTTAYPWGAHYMPIPNNDNTELLEFLEEIGVITGFNNSGLPIYNDYHLCHDPEERLYINGHWQEGLIPSFGINDNDRQQIDKFLVMTESLRDERGSDGKFSFAIPVDNSSTDEEYRKLDKMSFAHWLSDNRFTSEYLLWYLEYCCKDDYGTNLAQTSAYAGLHYFASRKGVAANADRLSVLTWPEGNGFLADGLKNFSGGNIHTGMLTYNVSIENEQVKTLCYDVAKGKSICVMANKLLLATPQYVNKHILPESLGDRGAVYGLATYAPWVVANITLSEIPGVNGAPLSWDNVIYGTRSVGYVYANHQALRKNADHVITYYLPVITKDAKTARQEVYNKDASHWQKLIMAELEYAHPGITGKVKDMKIYVWGHGMIQPLPGYIWSDARMEARKPIADKVFFAHSDLSGISIFEEAFYNGVRAAREIISTKW